MSNVFSVFWSPRQLRALGVSAFTLLELCRRASVHDGRLIAEATVPELAKEMGLDERSTQLNLRKLAGLEFIQEHRRTGLPTIFEIRLEAEGPGASGPDGGSRPRPALDDSTAPVEDGLNPEAIVPERTIAALPARLQSICYVKPYAENTYNVCSGKSGEFQGGVSAARAPGVSAALTPRELFAGVADSGTRERGRAGASCSAQHSPALEPAEQSGAEDGLAQPRLTTADWLGVEDRRWIVKLVDSDALVWIVREARDLGLSPAQLSRTIEVLRQRFQDPKRRHWDNARKMGFIRKGLRCGYGWKADAHFAQEREREQRSITARRDQAERRAAIETAQRAQDLDDAKRDVQRQSFDDMEARARRALAGDALNAMLARIDAARAKAGLSSRAAVVVSSDDPPTTARDFSSDPTEAQPASPSPRLRLVRETEVA